MHVHSHPKTKEGMKITACLCIWESIFSFVPETQSFFFIFRFYMFCVDRLQMNKGWVSSVCTVWVFNLSHPLCVFLFMFGWSWQDFCRWTSEDPLCSPHWRSEVGTNVLTFMCVHVHHTQIDKQRERERKKWAQEIFPVNEPGSSTKSTDGLPVIQLLQSGGNELCIVSVREHNSLV